MSYRDLVATIGIYEKDGAKKYITRNVGRIVETDKGTRVKLDASFNPAGCMRGDDGGVWLAAFDPKPRNDAMQQANQDLSARQPAPRQAPTQAQPQHFDNFDDDIPYANIGREIHIC